MADFTLMNQLVGQALGMVSDLSHVLTGRRPARPDADQDAAAPPPVANCVNTMEGLVELVDVMKTIVPFMSAVAGTPDPLGREILATSPECVTHVRMLSPFVTKQSCFYFAVDVSKPKMVTFEDAIGLRGETEFSSFLLREAAQFSDANRRKWRAAYLTEDYPYHVPLGFTRPPVASTRYGKEFSSFIQMFVEFSLRKHLSEWDPTAFVGDLHVSEEDESLTVLIGLRRKGMWMDATTALAGFLRDLVTGPDTVEIRAACFPTGVMVNTAMAIASRKGHHPHHAYLQVAEVVEDLDDLCGNLRDNNSDDPHCADDASEGVDPDWA